MASIALSKRFPRIIQKSSSGVVSLTGILASAFTAKIDAKLAEIQKEAKLPGFRPGQAPMNLIKSKYEAAVKGEALDTLIQEEVQKTFDKEKIKPALRPKVELDKFEDGKDITVKVEVEALPEVKVKDFTGLTVEKLSAKVEEADIPETFKGIPSTLIAAAILSLSFLGFSGLGN